VVNTGLPQLRDGATVDGAGLLDVACVVGALEVLGAMEVLEALDVTLVVAGTLVDGVPAAPLTGS
jgi:hypothetical protein